MIEEIKEGIEYMSKKQQNENKNKKGKFEKDPNIISKNKKIYIIIKTLISTCRLNRKSDTV